MGYACPVCEDPQADGEHLANHLAFTAMLGDDAHEAWLDDHAPGWSDSDPESLAGRVVDHAERREFPQVFEDTTGPEGAGGSHDHRHGAGGGHRRERGSGAAGRDHARDAGTADLPDDIDADVPGDGSVPEDVLAEARELTRERRRAGRSGEGPGATDDGDSGNGETATGDEADDGSG